MFGKQETEAYFKHIELDPLTIFPLQNKQSLALSKGGDERTHGIPF